MTAEGPAAPVAQPRRRLILAPSLQRRVSRFTLLIVTLAVLLTSLGGYVATRVSVDSAVDTILDTVAQNALQTLGPAPTGAALQRFVTDSSELDDDIEIAAVQADGQVLRAPDATVFTVDARDAAVAAAGRGAATHLTSTSTGAVYRVHVVAVGTTPAAALLVARPMAGARQILRSLSLALVAFGLLAVVVAGIAGRRVAQAGVAPVRELTAEVEARAAEDDLHPVRVARDDELGRLAVAFNHLLDSVRVSRTRQARFVADAGHELRTPLTSMRTNVELLAADADHAMLAPADRVTIMRDVRTQLMEFSSLVTDLIGLTREDRAYTELGEVDLTAVLEEAVDRVSMQAPGLRWDVDLDDAYLQGDADLLARAFANVLDNAVKYSPPGGTVTVTLKDGVVRIGDEGHGVTAEERPYVFDRFFRAEASRATPGTGLGLSITESVVHQHGGTVAVADAPSGGAQFVLTFPRAVGRADPR